MSFLQQTGEKNGNFKEFYNQTNHEISFRRK